MILERIEEQDLALQGLVNCRVSDPEVTLRAIRTRFPKVQVQLMRADRIAGKEHLIFAAKNAVRAFTQHYHRTHSLAVEMLLYTSCQRQISRAIQILGVTPQTREAVMAAFCDKRVPSDLIEGVAEVVRGSLNDDVLEITSKDKARELAGVYSITRTQMEATRFPGENEDSVLKRLIVERSALLTLES